jgi:enoyl-CoA hydratase/carnithine racemase
MSDPEVRKNSASLSGQVAAHVRGGVGLLTLNRPERGNAFTPLMGREMSEALRGFERDPNVRCVVVTGAGRHFCVGADLERGDDTFKDVDESPSAETLMARFSSELPVIGAINGSAVGIGLTMALHWDVLIAADDAKLGFPFVRRGVVPESGANWLLPRLIGGAKAADLLMTGRLILGKEAAAMSLVSQAVPREGVLDSALQLADEIARECAPSALRATKRLLQASREGRSLVESAEIERAVFECLAAAPDAREGARAFLERRTANWSAEAAANIERAFEQP